MAETSYPSSDLESGGELELANDWLKEAIQKEVFRGTKLRERKVRPPSDVTAKFPKPPTPARSICKERRLYRKASPSPNRSNSNGVDGMRERARSISPFLRSTRTSSVSRRDSSSHGARRARPVCSMRISELAVPTKRQCIDTWRNKSGVLPGPMVNRLKQQVMDQTPIVKVSDAVNCFRQASSSPSKKRASRKINKEAIKSRNQEENQYISTIFGHKIAQKLIKPVNAKLNSQLQNVSSIVSNEICDVLRDKAKLKTDDATHERMVRETADKVTIWIANILEETSEKLLEEDLRVKKVNERTFATDGELITLIGTMVRQEAELEEQEGPALDILDDLVDNVLSVCGGAESDIEATLDLSSSIAQKSIDEDNENTGGISDYISVSSANNDDTEFNERGLQEALKDNTNELAVKPVDDEDSLKDHLMKQLNEIIDRKLIDTLKSNDILENISIDLDNHPEYQTKIEEKRSESLLLPLSDIKNSEYDTRSTPEVDHQAYNYEENSSEKERAPLDDVLNQIYEAKTESEKNAKVDESMNDQNNDTAGIKEEVDNIDNNKVEDNDKVEDSDKVEDNDIVEDINFMPADEKANDTIEPETRKNEEPNASEEFSEERDKKVQFSYDNFGLLKDIKQSKSTHSPENLYLYNDKIPEQTTNNVIQDKKLDRTNDSVLRNIDEPWPEDLSAANLIKPAESVSKSITSLGKLLESDERNYLSLEEETLSGIQQEFITQPHQESTEQFNSLGVNYDDFLDHNNENNQHDASSKLKQGSDDIDRNSLNKIDELKHDMKDISETVPGENTGAGDNEPKQIVENINQGESVATITDVEMKNVGLSKPNIENENVEQQEPSAPINGKELEASFSQLKDEINKINIQNEASEPSLVSMMISALQKYDDKLQDISIRDQSDSDISKKQTAFSERSNCAQHLVKRKLNGKIQQKHLRQEAMPTDKFDYRVHPNTAPLWIRRGRGQGDLGAYHKPMGCSGMKGLTEREREIRKWCKDLDNILLNLDKWRSWLEYITKYITALKEKAALNKLNPRHNNKIVTSDRPKPPRNVEKDAMWTKLNHRAKGGLKLYKNDEAIKFKISPTPPSAKYCVTCGCKKHMKRLSRSPRDNKC